MPDPFSTSPSIPSGRPDRQRGNAAGLITVVALVLSGCSAPGPAERAAATAADGAALVHVHGLGVDPGEGGAVYAASHTGVWRIPIETTATTWSPAGEPEQVAGRAQDTMGFTVTTDGTFLASGHPDPAEGPSPAHLGLVRSTDAARTWEAVSLAGQVDFHDLEAATSPDGTTRVVGYDATRGVVVVSTDGGATWADGAALQARDLALDPRQARTVYATTARATMVSTDAGASFTPLPDAPPGLLLIEAQPPAPGASPTLTGIDTDGQVWTAQEAAGPWTHGGHLPGTPAALTVLGGPSGQRLLAADDLGIHTTTDAGSTWQTLAVTTPDGHR